MVYRFNLTGSAPKNYGKADRRIVVVARRYLQRFDGKLFDSMSTFELQTQNLEGYVKRKKIPYSIEGVFPNLFIGTDGRVGVISMRRPKKEFVSVGRLERIVKQPRGKK